MKPRFLAMLLFSFAVDFGFLHYISAGHKPAVSYLRRHDVNCDVRFISPQATRYIDRDETTSREVLTIMLRMGTNSGVSRLTLHYLVKDQH